MKAKNISYPNWVRLASFVCLVQVMAFSMTTEAAIARWGCSGANTPVPSDLTNVQAIAAGDHHWLALKADGTVLAWGGSAAYGEADVPVGLSNVTAIAAGGYHSLARKSDGTIVGWGAGGPVPRPPPYTYYDYGQSTIPTGLSNVIAVSAGLWHSVALKSDGTVVAWGWNAWGGIGPTNVPAGLSGVTSIAAGYAFSMALKGDGTVVAWGQAPGGPFDVTVPLGLNNVVAIAAGTTHALALKGDGSVASWGWPGGSLTNVPLGLNSVMAIAAGYQHSIALKSDGTVVGWGTVSVPPSVFGATAIGAGSCYSLASGASVAITPQIDRQPLDQTAAEGAPVSFEVLAQGGAPRLHFQWRFNGIPIAGATNSVFALASAQPNHAGNYSVFISNSVGTALSRTAKLEVQGGNDSFARPLSLPPSGGRSLSSNTSATKEPSEPDHAGNLGGKSVWFIWHAVTNCIVTVDTVGSTFDTLLAVYTGYAVNDLNLIAADDDGANFQRNSRLSFSAVGGTTYRIAVDGYNDGGSAASGGIVLNLAIEQPIVLTPVNSAPGEFKFEAAGSNGRLLVVEVSSDLALWFPVATNVVSGVGVITFAELGVTNHATRYFRAVTP